MDYVFFAFSSLSLSFSILLLIVLTGRANRLLGWKYIVAAAIAGFLYYTLLISVSREQLTTYYLLNMLPQGILFILLILLLKRKTK